MFICGIVRCGLINWIILCLFVFFFFKQKTAYEMRISDWSSDVCSSDLTGVPWIGEDRSPEAREREHRFCVFKTPEHGFRALVRVLLTYQRKYRLRTVAGMIDRWAPPVENNTG